MSSRYLTNLVTIVAGGFLVVASQAFGVATFEWLMFAIGILALTTVAIAAVIPGRGVAQHGLDVLEASVAAWTIVASLVFAGATITWLGFASGAALVALAIAGLTAHELSTERVVHSFELRGAPVQGPANGTADQGYSPSEHELAGTR